MRIEVRVKPGSKFRRVERRGKQLWVWVRSPAEKGRANEELREVLAEYFGVAKSSIAIKRGSGSRVKLLEVEGLEELEGDDR
jgi:uncharacterized protein YggU (UPF0235/DUF167 family)